MRIFEETKEQEEPFLSALGRSSDRPGKGFRLETSIRVHDQIETSLPPRLRLLCIGALEPSWVSLTLQLDAEGCMEPIFKWVSTASEALALLRKESFDCLLINHMFLDSPEEQGTSSLHLVRAVRASGCDDPVVVVAATADDATWTEVCRLQVELLLTPNGLESMAVVPMLKRAVRRVDVMRENHRMAMSERRRLTRERNEAGHLLNEQRQIIRDLADIVRLSNCSAAVDQLPTELNDYYQELLRTYVIMGCGGLGAEIAKLAELLAVAGLSPREALELHLERVEELVRGLGSRSTRHVMARADLLALELMIHLGECYQGTLK
ncbi:hypothetical protein Pan258_59250 [Symmachiella dynata]|nr:hypothetical protein Pan258_59250 [Symmachiella dynata]